jgi:hypothetical protein
LNEPIEFDLDRKKLHLILADLTSKITEPLEFRFDDNDEPYISEE